jgi:hypothetical protein
MLRVRQAEIIVTGDARLDDMYRRGGLTFAHVQRAFEVVQGAMSDADRSVQLRAAELLGQWLGWKPRERDSTPDRVAAVSVTLVSAAGADAGTQLPRGRLEVHLAGNGHAAGIPPAGEREQSSD